jgi:mono/diheme cytochrome c family protein
MRISNAYDLPSRLSAALATLLAIGQAQAQPINQRAARDLLLAKALCAACHAVEKYSPSSRDPAAPRFEHIANSPGITAISKALQTTPYRKMPNLKGTRDVINDVVAYILSVKANH